MMCCCDIGHIWSCASPVQAVIPTGTECHRTLGPCSLGLGQGWGGQDVSPRGARSAEPVLMLSGPEGVILHLSGPAAGAGTPGDSRREGDLGVELGEVQSDQREEKQALGVIVTEPLNTTYKQARRALGGGTEGPQRRERVRAVRSGPGPGGGSGFGHQRGWAGGGLAACGGLAASPAAPERSPEDRAGC